MEKRDLERRERERAREETEENRTSRQDKYNKLESSERRAGCFSAGANFNFPSKYQILKRLQYITCLQLCTGH